MTDLLDRVDAAPAVDTPAELPAPASAPPVPGAGRPALAAALAGAGAIHLAMAPSHLDASALEGTGFLVAGFAQFALAAVFVARSPRWARGATVALGVALVATWAVSRTAGLPVGAHEGEAEDVTVVDGICVALEAAAVGLALLARRRAPRAAVAGALAALALTGTAVASPDARDHAVAHGHGDEVVAGDGLGDGHGHGNATTAGDDLGFGALQNGQMGHDHGDAAPPTDIDPGTAGALAQQLALTAPLVQQFPTIADARAAGYRQAGPFSPGLGTHYIDFGGQGGNGDGDMDPEDIAAPTLIYDGITDDAPLAGFMYMAYQDTPPEGFVGPLDLWHYHTNTCIVFGPDGIETPFGADLTGVTEEMCTEVGGSFLDFTGYMVHVWTVPGYESELGTFSDLNPAIRCPDGTYFTVPVTEVAGRDSTCRNP
jgi:hypothetical protein